MREVRYLLFLVLVVTLGKEALAKDYVIPAATRSPGEHGSLWVTDVKVLNKAFRSSEMSGIVSADRAIQLLYISGGQTRTVTVSPLAPGSEGVYEDILMTQFGIERGTGIIIVRTDWPISVWCRTYDASPQGTKGQYVPAFEASNKFLRQSLHGISNTVTTRTNIGVVNLNSTATTFTVSVYKKRYASGDVSRPIDSWTSPIAANSMVQVAVNSEEFESGFAEIIAGQKVFAYASIIDNNSNDAVFVPGAFQVGPEMAYQFGRPVFYSCPCTGPTCGTPCAEISPCAERPDCRTPFNGLVCPAMSDIYPIIKVARPVGTDGHVLIRNARIIQNGRRIDLGWDRFDPSFGPVGSCGHDMGDFEVPCIGYDLSLCKSSTANGGDIDYCFAPITIGSGYSSNRFAISAVIGKENYTAQIHTPSGVNLSKDGSRYVIPIRNGDSIRFEADVKITGNLGVWIGLNIGNSDSYTQLWQTVRTGITQGPTDGWTTLRVPNDELVEGTNLSLCP